MSATSQFFGSKVFAGMTRKAWLKFTGATGAILASSNIASVVRNATGDYTITFTTAMSGTSYVCPGATQAFDRGNASDDPPYAAIRTTTSTTVCNLVTKVAGAAIGDCRTTYVEFWE